MKFNKLGCHLMFAGVSAALALGTTACSRDYVAAYVFSTSASTGNVSAFAVDYQTGILNQVSGSPFQSQLQDPTSAIASPNGKTLYVIGGPHNAAVSVMSIGTDGKLYAKAQPTLPTGDTYPTGAAMDSTGKYLYVTYQYQNGFGPSSNGPGGLAVFTLNADSGDVQSVKDYPLTAPTGYSSVVTPKGVTNTVPITNYNNAVFIYVAAQATSTATGQSVGVIFGYQQNGDGTLSLKHTIAATVNPSAIISEPTGRYVYISDRNANQIVGEQILDGTGTLQPLVSSPYSTGLTPVQMTVDPRGKFLYTVNYNSSTVSGYNINHADGSLGSIAGVSNFNTGTGPTCVTVDPSVGLYLYTSDYINHSISAAQLKSEDGTLTTISDSPFPVSQLPSCVTSVANGSHALSLVYPN